MTNNTSSIAPTRAELERRRRIRWPNAVVTVVFGLFYAYYLFDAIRSLIELPAFYEESGFDRSQAPWTLLVIGVVLPVAGFVAACVLGRHHTFLSRALVFLAGLGVVSCLSLAVVVLGRT